jgi:signal-transduction protein with cAMP-binding, CBS, and nucleotidyltransferase domain
VTSAIDTLETRLGANWNAIRAARRKTEEIVGALGMVLADLYDETFSIVVKGSLGRGEATVGSDVDWILLIDGPSYPEHALLLRQIGDRIRALVPKEVGPTGTFGDIVASHELVHYIAGTRDSTKT